MTTMDWNTILNWRLLADSHEFPGPKGGTCINEAAVVAAGFEYRAIHHVHDCPKCFSRFFAAFLMGLNDGIDDDERQELMPFVVRLAGSADANDVERQRALRLLVLMTRRLGPFALKQSGIAQLADLIDALERVETVDEAYAALMRVKQRLDEIAYTPRWLTAFVTRLTSLTLDLDDDTPLETVNAGERLSSVPLELCEYIGGLEAYRIAIEALDEVFKIGAQATPLETATVVERMETAKAQSAVSADA